MKSNKHVPLDQGFQKESTAGASNSRIPVENSANKNYVSIQTGEEFSSEFLRDRSTLKVGTSALPAVQNQEMLGFNNEHDHQMTYEDLTRILGISRVDSECGSEVAEFSSAQGCAPDMEHWSRSDRRCHIDDTLNAQGGWDVNGVVNSTQVNLGARLPSVSIPQSPSTYNPYDLGSSEGSQPGKLRILCSFGGRILPRPSDSKLRYVGGETRIISIRKNISWEELTLKTSGLCNQPHSIKYQLPGEDLDALISVSSDEDLQNMLEEYNGMEKSAGSPRLRIFLIPASETEIRGSGTLQHGSPDYDYVVAVNGIVDPSPRKLSGEQLFPELAKTGSTLDRLPSFYGESSSSLHRAESRDGPSFSQPHVAKESLNTTRSPAQSPSFSTKPAQHMYLKTGVLQWNEDNLWKHSGESNISFAQPNAPRHESFFQVQQGSGEFMTPVTEDSENLNGGQPSLSGRPVHHERYMSQVDSRAFMLGSVDSLESCRGMIHAYSDSQLQQYGEKSSYCYPEGESPSSSLHFVNPAISSQPLSTPLQDNIIQLQENIHIVKPEVHNQLIDMDTSQSCKVVDFSMPMCSKPLECNPYLESSSKTLNDQYLTCKDKVKLDPIKQNPNDSNLLGFEMMDRVLNPDSLLHQGVPELKFMNGDFNHINADTELPEIQQHVALTSAKALLASREHDYQVERTSSDSIKSHKHAEVQQYNFTGDIIDEALGRCSNTVTKSHGQNQEIDPFYGLADDSFVSFGQQPVASSSIVHHIDSKVPEHSKNAGAFGENNLCCSVDGIDHLNEKLDKLEVGHGDDVSEKDNEIGQAETSNMHKKNQLEPLLVIEDVSNYMPEAVNFSSLANPIVDLFSDIGSEQPIVAGEHGISTKNCSEDSKASGLNKDDSDIDAVMAEIEAGLYGLQIIKNADLEELRELGSGTYGTVYHGKWRGTDVAIKRIKKSCFSGRSSEQERLTGDFWREAHILSKLHHPNVVAFYGVVPDGAGGTLATVTEFMVNGSLRNVLLKKDRSLDRRRKLIIAMDAAFGMEYLHSKNIVHFDLKCDNLLVNMRDPQRPICKVGDFGLSRIKRNTLVSGGVRGTLPWMAPELLNGSSTKVSEKVDVFSFGIAMWEILTGEEPYANMHCGAIIGGILKDTLRPPVPERCDPEWRKLMEQCWSTEPGARPSFSEVTSRLRSMSNALSSRGHTRSLSGRG
ncbi:unnamed protein product [Amaranthus hypochondriacus]